MTSRRRFIEEAALAVMAIKMPERFSFLTKMDRVFSYESQYFRLQLLRDRPAFSFFSTDSLGGSQFSVSPLLITKEPPEEEYESQVRLDGIAYFSKRGKRNVPLWEFSMQPETFTIRTRWNKGETPLPVVITFSQTANHCTVLGVMPQKNRVQLPCVLHFPGMGSFRIYSSDPSITLFYDADRNVEDPFVKISFPSADAQHPDVTYRFESVAIYPENDKIRNDGRFDGFRRNYINIFQLNPRIQALANNSASDNCAFTLFLYAEMARHTPELVKGLNAMHLIRNTLDKYIGGMKGYGQVGYEEPYNAYYNCDSSDSAPSLIISACDYILDTKDNEWAKQNYAAIKGWATRMIATDTNHDGIIEYCHSGNSGSWTVRTWSDKGFVHPANWWDTIGFGHDDAYSNALAYRACTLLARVARTLDRTDDSQYYDAFAKKLKGEYFSKFYNPETGVLGGWRSEDGQLHDYYFTFVNSVAICYDLINEEDANRIMRTLIRKMREVGYIDFRLGLPGNLIAVADKDYVDHRPDVGYGKFQVYENGGATGCFVYFTIHALYKLGMREEAEAILFPMLKSYKMNDFQGYCADSNRTKDWKTWKGECWGYEGFLVDSYLALLNVLDYTKSI